MLVLVGFMGSGKTTVGRALAGLTGLPFIDTDEEIERRAGRSVAEIFASEGEGSFREVEREVVEQALSRPAAIVALGGGAHLDPATAARLEWVDVVHLDASFRTVMARVGEDPARPLLRTRDPLALYEARREGYERVARKSVLTDGRSPEEIAHEIAGVFDLPLGGSATRRVRVDAASGYEVTIGAGAVAELAALIPELAAAEKVCVLTHPELRAAADGVAESLRARVPWVSVLEVTSGEASKSLDQAATILGRLAQASFHRDDLVVVVGGGVLGDLGGFVASIYARGIGVVQVPTTLLAQVDAAVGGKTGVNLPAAKNLVGTIHQPRAVVADVCLLATLPERDYRSGLAEVVKYGFIRDAGFLSWLASSRQAILDRDEQTLVSLVERCVAIKAAVVARDEREGGERAILNYGHTVGHAIEAADGYGAYLHGEAVALGMMAAAHVAHMMGRIDRSSVDLHRDLLNGFGLPVSAALDPDRLEPVWVNDKKYRKGMKLVLLSTVGRAEYGVPVEASVLRRAVEALSS